MLIPIISALLFRAGGSDQWKWCPLNQKLWRWLMGVPIAGIAFYLHHSLWVLLAIPTYLVATNVFGYGDKTPILKYLPQNIKHLVSGMIFGACSFVLIPWYFALLQVALSGAAFYYVEVKKINNPWAELLRGGIGTCLM